MGRDEAIARIRSHEAELRASGITALYLFGSVARDEADAHSDVDLAFEIGDAPDFSLMSHALLQDRLADLVGISVDLVETASLRTRIKARFDSDKVRIF